MDYMARDSQPRHEGPRDVCAPRCIHPSRRRHTSVHDAAKTEKEGSNCVMNWAQVEIRHIERGVENGQQCVLQVGGSRLQRGRGAVGSEEKQSREETQGSETKPNSSGCETLTGAANDTGLQCVGRRRITIWSASGTGESHQHNAETVERESLSRLALGAQSLYWFAVDWIFSSRIKVVGLEPIVVGQNGGWRLRAVLDILEVFGRFSW